MEVRYLSKPYSRLVACASICLRAEKIPFRGCFHKDLQGTRMGESCLFTATNLRANVVDSRSLTTFTLPLAIFIRHVVDCFDIKKEVIDVFFFFFRGGGCLAYIVRPNRRGISCFYLILWCNVTKCGSVLECFESVHTLEPPARKALAADLFFLLHSRSTHTSFVTNQKACVRVEKYLKAIVEFLYHDYAASFMTTLHCRRYHTHCARSFRFTFRKRVIPCSAVLARAKARYYGKSRRKA